MLSFNIGLSALSTSEQALNVIGENITNANTTGYHQQNPLLVEQMPVQVGNLSLGSGVAIAQIERQQSTLIDNGITTNTFESNATTSALNSMQQLQSALTPGTGSLDTLLNSFFSDLQQLQSSPDDLTQRSVFLNSATSLTSQLNTLSGDFATLGQNIDLQANQLVSQANALVPQIATLNGEIQQAEVQGTSPNTELDQRDQLINQLAAIVNVQVVAQPDGQVNILAAGTPLVVGTQANALQYSKDSSGNAILTQAGSQTPLNVTGGQLGGLIAVRNQSLPAYVSQLNTLAQGIAQQMNELQATGLGLSGPSTFLSGTQSVSDPSKPLANANLAFPVQAGSLFIGVTDQATGQRTLSKVQIDPATQSLQDVATALSGVAHVQAVVDPQTNTLQILAQPGYAVDFAGGMSSAPDTSALTGTATAQIGGAYSGTTNDNLTYTVQGSGTVGVTPNLTLQVTNSAGGVVTSLNIGQGYSPGSALQVGKGVTVQLASGTVNNGDNFTSNVVAQPDTAGILSALGINSFFTGTSANNLAVQPNLLNNPGDLSASTTGQPGDSSNLQKMAALAQTPTLTNGTQTFSQFYASMVGNIGAQVQNLTQLQSAQQVVGQNLQAQQQAVSGVDPNEQLVYMLQSQNAYQMASKYIQTVNSVLDDLMSIIGTTPID